MFHNCCVVRLGCDALHTGAPVQKYVGKHQLYSRGYTSNLALHLSSCRSSTDTWQHQSRCGSQVTRSFSKRTVLFCTLISLSNSVSPQTASAWDGPAKLLKSRQQANISKLTAPLDVSLKRLQEAEQMGREGDYRAALQLVRSASCNCYPFEPYESDSFETKMSVLTQNLNLADPCTFRIVVKNVTSLMSDTDALKVATKATLTQLVSSFQELDDCLYFASDVDSEARGKIGPAFVKVVALEEQLKEQIVLCVDQEA